MDDNKEGIKTKAVTEIRNQRPQKHKAAVAKNNEK
jgi:hypothetical protein